LVTAVLIAGATRVKTAADRAMRAVIRLKRDMRGSLTYGHLVVE